MLKGIGSLVDRSLVQVVETAGATRYRLLETVREFARAELEVSGQAEAARRRHAAYFLCLAEDRLNEPDQHAWHARLIRERETAPMLADWSGSDPPLSERERAVLRLIAGGLANKQPSGGPLDDGGATLPDVS